LDAISVVKPLTKRSELDVTTFANAAEDATTPSMASNPVLGLNIIGGVCAAAHSDCELKVDPARNVFFLVCRKWSTTGGERFAPYCPSARTVATCNKG
jgi:hypothetical protein